jgi:non-ribosomal peptide synthetase component E (peptide arylation enzyme)
MQRFVDAYRPNARIIALIEQVGTFTREMRDMRLALRAAFVDRSARDISKEIEDVLYEYPGVLEAAVIGVPDEEWGERVQAFVSLTGERAASPAQLHEFLAGRLASFKRPQIIEVLAELPKNSVGKIAKAQLREPF